MLNQARRRPVLAPLARPKARLAHLTARSLTASKVRPPARSAQIVDGVLLRPAPVLRAVLIIPPRRALAKAARAVAPVMVARKVVPARPTRPLRRAGSMKGERAIKGVDAPTPARTERAVKKHKVRTLLLPLITAEPEPV